MVFGFKWAVRLANYGTQAKPGPLPVFIEKSFTGTHIHSFTYCLCQLLPSVAEVKYL